MIYSHSTPQDFIDEVSFLQDERIKLLTNYFNISANKDTFEKEFYKFMGKNKDSIVDISYDESIFVEDSIVFNVTFTQNMVMQIIIEDTFETGIYTTSYADINSKYGGINLLTNPLLFNKVFCRKLRNLDSQITILNKIIEEYAVYQKNIGKYITQYAHEVKNEFEGK